MANLTNKRRVFLNEYLKCWNATEAARRAQYKHPNVKGSQLVKVSQIQEEIERRLKANAMSADEIISRLSDMGRVDISFFINPDGTLNMDHVREKGHLVKSIMPTAHGLKLELHDAQSALVHMGRHRQLFTDKVRVETWQDEVANLLRAGTVTPEEVVEEIGSDLAQELFKRIGLVVITSREDANREEEASGGS